MFVNAKAAILAEATTIVHSASLQFTIIAIRDIHGRPGTFLLCTFACIISKAAILAKA